MQVLVQLLLHILDSLVAVDQVFKCSVLVASVKNDWIRLGLRHDDAPHLVHRLEGEEDFWQLLLDVFRVEDRPQVAPTALGSAPLLKNLLHLNEAQLPVKGLAEEEFSVGRTRD